MHYYLIATVSVASVIAACICFTDMFLGFPERFSFVRENMFPTLSAFPIYRTVHALRESEIDYSIKICVTYGSTATVTEFYNLVGAWDASFGYRDYSRGLILSYILSQGETNITNIRVWVMNDLSIEDNETFTLRISSTNYYGYGQSIKCYEDDETPVEGNYFCQHTITIVDEDGQSQKFT